MGIFKNRTAIGLLCVVLPLVICLVITPMSSRMISEKTEIIRIIRNIRIGDEITKDMVELVETESYNLPESVIRNTDGVIDKYVSTGTTPGDCTIRSKVAEGPAVENVYLYNLNREKQVIFVSVKAFANGLSEKLISGDIVSTIASDYRKQGSVIVPSELQYVEVVTVTANSGYDTNTEGRGDEKTEKELPGTVALLVAPKQGRVLAELEAEGKLHLSLVYWGTEENAQKFVKIQGIMLEELCPLKSEEMEENTEKESGTEEIETVEETSEETVRGKEVEVTVRSESGVG